MGMGGGGWVGGKIIPRIRLTSAKDLVEVEAELGNMLRFHVIHVGIICVTFDKQTGVKRKT